MLKGERRKRRERERERERVSEREREGGERERCNSVSVWMCVHSTCEWIHFTTHIKMVGE